jgi:hypothetical protein
VFVGDVIDVVFVEVVTENRELTLILTQHARQHGTRSEDMGSV